MTGATSYVAKGLLPYHGLGSGIKRALAEWPAIDFADDHEGCLFTANRWKGWIWRNLYRKVHRKPMLRRESVRKVSGKILDACRENPSVTIPELAELIGITERSVQRNIQNLQKSGLLRRISGRKEGHWEVIE